MPSPAILAHLRRKMQARRSVPLAIVTGDGVWLDGDHLTLEAYTAAYSGLAREEIRAEGLGLSDLD